MSAIETTAVEGFPVVKIGRRRIVPVAAADAWMAARAELAVAS
jgi:hypothetical protein